MPTRIPEALRRILTEQYQGDHLDRILAQVFQAGASVVFHSDGTKEILPQTTVEIEIGDGQSYENFLPLQTPSGEWDELLSRPPKTTVIAVFPGNFGRGMQGKHDQETWKKDNFTPEDAPIRRGYAVTGGHRGGMRQATSRPILMKLMDQSYKLRKYR